MSHWVCVFVVLKVSRSLRRRCCSFVSQLSLCHRHHAFTVTLSFHHFVYFSNVIPLPSWSRRHTAFLIPSTLMFLRHCIVMIWSSFNRDYAALVMPLSTGSEYRASIEDIRRIAVMDVPSTSLKLRQPALVMPSSNHRRLQVLRYRYCHAINCRTLVAVSLSF